MRKDQDVKQISIDLHNILKQSLNYLTRNPNPEKNYLPYFGGKIPENGPPILERCPWDYGDGIGRFLEANYLIKQSCWMSIPGEVEDGLWQNIFETVAADGLSYSPETHWSDGNYGSVWYQRGLLAALLLRYKDKQNPEDLNKINQVVDTLDSMAFREDGFTYFYYSWDREHQWISDVTMVGEDTKAPCFILIDCLTLCAEITGNEKALNLAKELVYSLLDSPEKYYNENGAIHYPASSNSINKFLNSDVDYLVIDGKWVQKEAESAWLVDSGHFHSRSHALLGLIRYSILTSNRDLLSHARRIYNYLYKTHVASFGWAPENLLTAGRECSEMCSTADLVLSQILLGRAGYSEYWEHCECFLRNHIVQAHFFPTEEMRELEKQYLFDDSKKVATDAVSCNNVLDRLAGGFVGPIYPDDLFCYYPSSRKNPKAIRRIDISGCCAPSGIKAVASALSFASEVKKDRVSVNLLMDHETDAICVTSNLPKEGSVTIETKLDTDLFIRVPNWCKEGHGLTCSIGNLPQKTIFNNGYIVLKKVTAHETVRIDFNLEKKSECVNIGEIQYRIDWKGYNVTKLTNLSNYTPLAPRYT